MKNIWMYWENQGRRTPEYIELCIESIRRRKGSLAFHLLNKETVGDYLPSLRQEWFALERAAHRADYIRTRLVHRYGGIWIDCDMAALDTLEPLVEIPTEFDYACQSLGSSIGCFAARPGCELLSRMLLEQDRVLNEVGVGFKWHEIGNGLLRKLGEGYPHHQWKQWTLDEISQHQVSTLLSRRARIADNVDQNAVLFHFCNEVTGKAIEANLRNGRALRSKTLVSKILRRALGEYVPDADTDAKWALLEDLKDRNFGVYGRKLMRKLGIG